MLFLSEVQLTKGMPEMVLQEQVVDPSVFIKAGEIQLFQLLLPILIEAPKPFFPCRRKRVIVNVRDAFTIDSEALDKFAQVVGSRIGQRNCESLASQAEGRNYKRRNQDAENRDH